jgi:hypothetical protein
LDNFEIGPSFGKGAHVEQVGSRKSLHLGESGSEVAGETLDYFGAPTLLCLSGEYVLSKLPVKSDELTIDRKRGPLLCLLNADLKFRQP